MMFVISIILYAITITMISHQMYSFTRKQKIQFISVGVVVIFIVTIILCQVSASQIQEEIVEKVAITKQASVLLFAPILSIIVLPFLGNTWNEYKIKQIEEAQVKKRLLVLVVIIILVLVLGMGYIQNFQLGLLQSASK